MVTETIISYAIGDLVNGDYKVVATLEEALRIYNEDVASGAKIDFRDKEGMDGFEDWTFEQSLTESKVFHYVAKITRVVGDDEDGDGSDEVDQSHEIIEGGTSTRHM